MGKAKAKTSSKRPAKFVEESEEEDADNNNNNHHDHSLISTMSVRTNRTRANVSTMSTMSTMSRKRIKITVKAIHDRGTGQIYTFGQGDCGQLGHGPEVTKRNYPCLVDGLKNKEVVQIVAGGMHTAVLDSDGNVWTNGVNDDKALGRRTEEEEDGFEPGQVNLGPVKIVQISAGDSHTAVLTEEGDVFAWGTFKDMNGNFGLVPGNPEKLFETPQRISELIGEKVIKIASGDNHLVMLTETKKIFSCGTGEQGQLGRPLTATEATERVTRSRSRNANLLTPRDVLLTPTRVNVGKKIKDVWTGGFSTYCLTERNEMYVFGLNNYRQLGIENVDLITLPTKSASFSGKKWKDIAAGQHHAVALDEDGSVYTLGRGVDGRLGLGDNVPEAVAQPTLVPALNRIECIQIAAGLSTAYAITSNGKVYAWGCGVNYQLGTGSPDHLTVPKAMEHIVIDKKKIDWDDKKAIYVSAGGQHCCVIISREL